MLANLQIPAVHTELGVRGTEKKNPILTLLLLARHRQLPMLLYATNLVKPLIIKKRIWNMPLQVSPIRGFHLYCRFWSLLGKEELCHNAMHSMCGRKSLKSIMSCH